MRAYEAEAKEHLERSVVPVLRWVAVGFGILLLLFFAASMALAAGEPPEVTVVILDLSNSVALDGEFDANLHFVERLISLLPVGGASLAVLGLDGARFTRRPLLRESSPSEAGRFGEYLDAWRIDRTAAWRRVASTLKPIASGSDLFGAIARAALELEDERIRTRRLVILSDMRQAGRGINLERPVDAHLAVVKKVEGKGLIPRLEGVQVWALGVHTAAIDERHWSELRAFWAAYFGRAGAQLRAFTPNRRMDEK